MFLDIYLQHVPDPASLTFFIPLVSPDQSYILYIPRLEGIYGQ